MTLPRNTSFNTSSVDSHIASSNTHPTAPFFPVSQTHHHPGPNALFLQQAEPTHHRQIPLAPSSLDAPLPQLPPPHPEKGKERKKTFGGFFSKKDKEGEEGMQHKLTKEEKKKLKLGEGQQYEVHQGGGGYKHEHGQSKGKEEDLEDSIFNLCHLPSHAYQSTSERELFHSRMVDLARRLYEDPAGGNLAERVSRHLRKEIKMLPSDVEKLADGSGGGEGGAGSIAEVWWTLMGSMEPRILSTSPCFHRSARQRQPWTLITCSFFCFCCASEWCSTKKFLADLESSLRKLPPFCQQKIDLYHVFAQLSLQYRDADGSEDLVKYFTKLHEHSKATGIVRSYFNSLLSNASLSSESRC
jgi:hypothetical protein